MRCAALPLGGRGSSLAARGDRVETPPSGRQRRPAAGDGRVGHPPGGHEPRGAEQGGSDHAAGGAPTQRVRRRADNHRASSSIADMANPRGAITPLRFRRQRLAVRDRSTFQ